MGKHDFVIGCVGKPSAGKSTFFNAVTEGKPAKVGAYPFTTIEPNQGIGYFITNCPCKKFNVVCKPRFGSCTKGKRTVPIKMLDVAGLIPGASEGLGLGNKFLDDLRQADALLHIIDISGTTNEKGEATCGYDPSEDHDWLLEEIKLWIFNNLWKRWGSISRRHIATQNNSVTTLLGQLSGYGAKEPLIQLVLEDLGLTSPIDFTHWEKEDVMKLVSAFVRKRFLFVLVLNKVDLGVDATKNVIKLTEKFSGTRVVCTSAVTECFLKKMREQKYIDYTEGSMTFSTVDDDPTLPLKTPDLKVQTRLNNVKDMVLFRFGSTGVQTAIQKIVEDMGLIPVYPIRHIHTLGGKMSSDGAFPECILIKTGTTVREFAYILHEEIGRHFLYAEGPNGCRLAEHDIITEDKNILRYVTHRLDEPSYTHNQSCI